MASPRWVQWWKLIPLTAAGEKSYPEKCYSVFTGQLGFLLLLFHVLAFWTVDTMQQTTMQYALAATIVNIGIDVYLEVCLLIWCEFYSMSLYHFSTTLVHFEYIVDMVGHGRDSNPNLYRNKRVWNHWTTNSEAISLKIGLLVIAARLIHIMRMVLFRHLLVLNVIIAYHAGAYVPT